ncbi:MAG: DNA-binding protein Alba [Candidatus Pacearchaeota archaeon]|jgi:DNA-binding protein
MNKEEKTSRKEGVQKKNTNQIFIGNKPFMKYVIATIMQLKEESNNSATVKARGKFISRAVDVAEVVKKKVKETDKIELKDKIKINTEGFINEEGRNINISTIEINLAKK